MRRHRQTSAHEHRRPYHDKAEQRKAAQRLKTKRRRSQKEAKKRARPRTKKKWS